MKSHSLKLNFLSYCSVTFHAGWGYDFVFVCRYIKKLFQHLKQLWHYCNHNVFHFTNQLIRWRIKVCLTCLMATFAFRNSTKERYYLFRYEPFLWCYEDDSFWGLKPRFFFHLEEPTTQFLSTRQSKSTKSYTNKSLDTKNKKYVPFDHMLKQKYFVSTKYSLSKNEMSFTKSFSQATYI